jgi:diguanylate cyclase (GGDEF)-like protein/PAS domain S-box-containing protein
MTQNARQLRRAFLVTLLLFVGGMLAITAYTVWRLRAEAIGNGLEMSAMHSRGFEDFLTQSLHVTDLIADTILAQQPRRPDVRYFENAFLTTLRRAPFLRSLSLIDDRGRIVASSNPANVGMTLATKSYLPLTTGRLEILRIGQPWTGRDFASGKPTSPQTPGSADEASFIPVTQTLVVDDRAVTLLVALNPDYFINHISQKLDAAEGSVQVLRYDGTLLMSTDPAELPGSLYGYVARNLRLSEIESGKFEWDLGNNRRVLTAFRASSLYPLVVVTHLNRDYALRNWFTEAITLLGIVVPALLAISLLATVFYRRQWQLAAQRAEFERLQKINATVFDSSAEAILITGLNAEIISVNSEFTRITGYRPDEVIGRYLFPLLTPEGISAFTKKQAQQRTEKQPKTQADSTTIEVQLRCKSGSLIWMEILSTPERDAYGAISGYHRICRNITERKQAEEKLRLAASVFTHAREGIVITAADGTIIDVNEAFSQITGYSRDEALGDNPRLLRSDHHEKTFYAAMWNELVEKGHWHGEIWNRRKNGEMLAEILTISAVRDARGGVQQYVALFTDITALKEHERELEHIARFDALTNLPNRVLLADRLRQAMSQEQRRGQQLAVAFLDLDGFKAINDNHGHEAGDQLLVAIANRMKQALREGDTLARMGGDEFVAVLLDLADVATSVPTLTRLLDAAAQPVLFGDAVLQVSASLGVTFYPQAKDVEADQLLRQADQAMYRAKLAGKNRYVVFSE